MVELTLNSACRLIGDRSRVSSDLKLAKSREDCLFLAFSKAKAEQARLEQQKTLLKTCGAELIYRGLRSVEELEEEDRLNYKVRLTTERAKAIAAGNDAFDPGAFK